MAKSKTTADKKAKKSKDLPVTTFKNTKLNTVPLSWKEVWYTNCVLISPAIDCSTINPE